MISTFKTDYTKLTKDGEKRAVELRGLSTDTKPTENVENGSVFLEMDTGKIYFFDGENIEWKEV